MSDNAGHVIAHCKNASKMLIDYAAGSIEDEEILAVIEAAHIAAIAICEEAMQRDPNAETDPEHTMRKVFMLAFFGSIEWQACVESFDHIEELANPADSLTQGDLN